LKTLNLWDIIRYTIYIGSHELILCFKFNTKFYKFNTLIKFICFMYFDNLELLSRDQSYL